ncbi:hypothetical protein B0H14DRAFT_2653292 [Mycena olivaceomarginata]|nr:hypothetical protein B0H14DRAFT_2653292 [Mycena olivaceomarginata]
MADRCDKGNERVGLAIEKGAIKAKSGANKAVVQVGSNMKKKCLMGVVQSEQRNKAPVQYGPCPHGIQTTTANRHNEGDEQVGLVVDKGKSRADKAIMWVGSNVNSNVDKGDPWVWVYVDKGAATA